MIILTKRNCIHYYRGKNCNYKNAIPQTLGLTVASQISRADLGQHFSIQIGMKAKDFGRNCIRVHEYVRAELLELIQTELVLG